MKDAEEDDSGVQRSKPRQSFKAIENNYQTQNIGTLWKAVIAADASRTSAIKKRSDMYLRKEGQKCMLAMSFLTSRACNSWRR